MILLAENFLKGLLNYSPLLSLGLATVSLEGLAGKPKTALPWAVIAALMFWLLATSGWALCRWLLPSHYGFLHLPLLVVLYWLWQRLLRLFIKNESAGYLSLLLNGCLIIGGCLFLIGLKPLSPMAALTTSAGMAWGIFISLALIAYSHQKISVHLPAYLQGWPLMLLLCSLYWLAVQGLIEILL